MYGGPGSRTVVNDMPDSIITAKPFGPSRSRSLQLSIKKSNAEPFSHVVAFNGTLVEFDLADSELSRSVSFAQSVVGTASHGVAPDSSMAFDTGVTGSNNAFGTPLGWTRPFSPVTTVGAVNKKPIRHSRAIIPCLVGAVGGDDR
jgi:hypothetical protein